MAAASLLSLIIWLAASPLILLSRLIMKCNLLNSDKDLERCLRVVDRAPEFPARYVMTLIAAEDHRSALHPGVDPIGMVRALTVRIRRDKVQGASTIEQQLVRVVLGRYERTIRRKLWEQMIAIALSRSRKKERIAVAYLSVAYYGSGLYGQKAVTRLCGPRFWTANQESISRLVARLKYPESARASIEWQQTIERRVAYIQGRLFAAKRLCYGRRKALHPVEVYEGGTFSKTL